MSSSLASSNLSCDQSLCSLAARRGEVTQAYLSNR